MEIKFEQIINSKKNKPLLLLGSSRNMGNFPFEDFRGEIMVFGDTITRGRNLFKANYWVAANNEYPIPQIKLHSEILNKNFHTKFFFSHTAAFDNFWEYNPSNINKLIQNDWMIFDDRHFYGESCIPKKKCCKYISNKKYEKTIHEIFMDFFDEQFDPKRGATVAEIALMISLIMGFNPIFIQGVELPKYTKDYTHYECTYSDEIHVKTKKLMAKKYFYKYLANLTIFKKFINNLFSKKIHSNNKTYYDSKLGKKLIELDEKSIFFKDLDNSLRNFEIYSSVGIKNNFLIYNLSENSNLNKIANIKYLNPDKLKSKFNHFFSN